MTLCDCFYHYYDLALGIAILENRCSTYLYTYKVPKSLVGDRNPFGT